MERLCNDIEITNVQKNASKEWLELLERGKLKKEKESYLDFAGIILCNILGYSRKELIFEKNGIEFQYHNPDDVRVGFEAKGTDTNLFTRQHRTEKTHETPIKQLWNYMGGLGLEYGICTNYKQFVLIIRKQGFSKYYSFDFEVIRDDDTKLKEFVGIFSKNRLLDNNIVEKLLKESETEEKDFTDKFYELFHTTRLLLIKSFNDILNDKESSIHYTQIFLNRLVFIFFAEDKDFCPKILKDSIKSNLGRIITDESQIIYKSINELFGYFKNGLEQSHIMIPLFNGGLFKEEIPDNIYFNDLVEQDFFKGIKYDTEYTLPESTTKILKKYRNLNPIIKNIVRMSEHDFNTEVRVDILGHIFEQSITDLEKLQKDDSAIYEQRKKDGIYYTPEHVTDYICSQTIIRYLSKSGTVANSDDLIDEYAKEDDMSTLEDKFKKIKILDPACGSGAFLVKAVRVLIDIHDKIIDRKSDQTDFGQQNLKKSIAAAGALNIIKNNIYGVDINEQSAEITKLSLFLTLNSADTKLPDLSNNIKVGNSLIYKEFNWKENFKEIFDNGGFDIIIGNPPYIRQEEFKDLKKRMQLEPRGLGIEEFTIPGKTDMSGYFYYHALTWLKDNGYLGFITSDSWLHFGYGESLQKVMLQTCSIKILVRTAFNIFADADVKTVTAILQKTQYANNDVKFIYIENKEDTYGSLNGITKKQSELESSNWIPYFSSKQITPKIEMTEMSKLGKIKRGVTTGANDFFVITTDVIKKYNIAKKFFRPMVSKKTSGYYLVDSDASEYLLYVQESKGELQKYDEGKHVLEYIEKNDTVVKTKRGNGKKTRKISELTSVKSKKPWWYSLKLGEPPSIFLGIFADKRMRFFENNGSFYSTNNFAYLTPNNIELVYAFLAYLSSTYFALYLETYGHKAGGGALQFLTGDYKKALVPDFNVMSERNIDRLKNAWVQLKQDLDIKKLDDVVFDVLGFNKDEQKNIIKEFEKWNRDRLKK